MHEPEAFIVKLEEADKRMREWGFLGQWFGTADEQIRGVAGDVNGALFEALLKSTEYVDVDC
eukprot:9381602-Karenia_brevis.AAC.1